MEQNNGKMKFGSLFAGIGGFDLAFDRARMQCAWQVEIDDKCQQVLGHHWPDVPRYGDVRDVGKRNLESVDIIVGGFPCQDLSVAGRRAGLAGERSGLWWEFHRVIAELNPAWVVIENVPGLLSSNRGRDMGTLLWSLGEIGYGWAYRCLDAQYDGLAQRRKRVFIVGSLGDGRAAEVLFESESLPGHPPPGREAGAEVADPITKSFAKHGGASAGKDSYPRNIVMHALSGHNQRNDPDGEHFIVNVFNGYTGGPDDNDAQAGRIVAFDRTRGTVSGDVSAPLRACRAATEGVSDGKADAQCVAFDWQSGGDVRLNISDQHTSALQANQTPAVLHSGVRRLTPTECERLQGFPDGWTAVDGMSDTARYRMLGNAVAVPVAEWIGRRIVILDTVP